MDIDTVNKYLQALLTLVLILSVLYVVTDWALTRKRDRKAEGLKKQQVDELVRYQMGGENKNA